MNRQFKITGEKYAGVASTTFWNRVNALRQRDKGRLYSLGVALQNLEHQVLHELANAEVGLRKRRAPSDGEPT